MKENITNKILEINRNIDYDNFIIIHNFTLIILTEKKFLNKKKKKRNFVSLSHIIPVRSLTTYIFVYTYIHFIILQ